MATLDKRITHGMSYSSTYKRWQAMLDRCTNPKNARYENYGGRGITVDPRWLSFENFFGDMDYQPKGYSLERKDNDGNYTKDNCEWIPRGDQNKNKRNCIFVTYRGERTLLADACRALRIMPHGMAHRRKRFKETHQEVVDHYCKLRGVA